MKDLINFLLEERGLLQDFNGKWEEEHHRGKKVLMILRAHDWQGP